MSAALRVMPRILPRVWATASTTGLASAAEAVQQRKRPHCLRLVQTAVEAAPAENLVAWPRRQRAPEPTLAFYRQYTEAMLRRYVTLSMEQGRVPSLLGRELFRGKVTSCRVHAFDDVVIFVHDVGNCLKELEPGLRLLLRRIAIEDHTREETAAMLGLSLRTVAKRYGEALDRLTRVLLERRLLRPLMEGIEGS
jgi:hypothetical protein